VLKAKVKVLGWSSDCSPRYASVSAHIFGIYTELSLASVFSSYFLLNFMFSFPPPFYSVLFSVVPTQ
jgi:hypothetical protein